MKIYQEKETEILQGVIKLMEKGEPITTMTAQKIADAAGVGKATIYDYFPTKDRVINRAIIYHMNSQVNIDEAKVMSRNTFEEKICALYQSAIDSVNSSGSMFNIIMSAGGMPKFARRFHRRNEGCPLNGIMRRIFTMLHQIVDFGVSRGVIKGGQPKLYVDMVLMANFFSVFSGAGHNIQGQTHDRDALIKNAYTMLLKSLN